MPENRTIGKLPAFHGSYGRSRKGVASASTKELVSIDAYSYRENCTSAHDEASNAVTVSNGFFSRRD
jgi:hypothetical protein